jgi:Kef-type K+ transport system membrane component KefB
VLGLLELSGDRGVSVSLLAELGVLLLLLGVGMEMDLDELRRVGGPAMSVAVVGVALPFALGVLIGLAFGLETNTAIFFGAALTATSVGITARVFGDLRALASTEARIVLGAAVADDVLGLVVLTVVVKLVTGGSVGIGTVGETLGLAIVFLAATGIVGVLLIPRLFDGLARTARSQATVTIAGVALMLGFALLADLAKLAFIIGAFMAGLALGQTRQHERIAGDLNAVGNVLIPVFFVSIGINADLQAMADPGVIGLAAALTAVAIVGKVAAGWAVVRRPVDRFLIGLGMIPRGEVGLIFAAIGLSNGVLDDEQYGALLLVILVTTLITPPLLRIRLHHGAVDDAAPVTDTEGLVARALEAAAAASERDLTDDELTWFDQRRDVPVVWTSDATPDLLSLLRSGEHRSVRVLEATGVIDRALPEVSASMHRRRADLTDLDPLGRLRFPTIDRLRGDGTDVDDTLAIAALIADTCDDVAAATSLATRLGDDGSALELLDDARLIRRRALDPTAYDDRDLLQMATHLATTQRTESAARLAHALGDLGARGRESPSRAR